jgi:hypothetical protein
MKTIINNAENPVLEFAKRGIYSFQVLILGFAIPFLFLFGISNGNQKKINATQVNQVREMTNVSPSSNAIIGFYIPII